MAKSTENVLKFLNDLQRNMKPLLDKDMALMKKYLLQDVPGAQRLEAHDISYYRNKVEEIEYSVDGEIVKDFFPMEHVTEQLLQVYQELLDIKFELDESQETWHSDVKAYKCTDASTGNLMGWFYLDLYPREGKYSHAAVFPLQPGTKLSNGRSPAVCSLVCNFPKPSQDKPSLMRHDDVVTFFHEFGHAMHHICAEKVEFSDFAGTNVERDFVECPSQMLENWCWEKPVLKRLSKHYSTGEAMDDHLIEKLIKTRMASIGFATMRQITFAQFDQKIHTVSEIGGQADDANIDINQIYSEFAKNISGVEPNPGTSFPATFGHMCGYDAQYYGYLWSEVFSADLFVSAFKGQVMSKAQGKRYRELILGPGGSKDGIDILRDFLGREPDQKSFLTLKGL